MGFKAVLAGSLLAAMGYGLPTAESEDLDRRYNHPSFPGVDPVRRFVALGDSFSAGPGAGQAAPNDIGQCRRRLGAYAPQFSGSPPYVAYGRPPFFFESCTGNVVPDVQANQVQNVTGDTDLVMLSIGGNDIQFVPILTACVMNPAGNCDGTINTARGILYGNDFHQNYSRLIDTIGQNTGWLFRNQNTRRTAVYQTSYPPFFDAYTTQCNNVRFQPLAGPLLSQDLRDKLNLLGQELNSALANWIDEKNYIWSGPVPPAGATSFMKFSNQDEFFNQHRFCRDGVNEPDRNNPNTYFFNLFSNRDGVTSADDNDTVTTAQFTSHWNVDPNTCDPTVNTENEFADTIPCVIAKAIANDTSGDDNGILWPATPESIQKTFHPRTNGFNDTSLNLQYDSVYELPGQLGSPLENKNFRIMSIGDSLAFGLSDNIFNVNGYRQQLYQLLTAPNANNQVSFVGSQRQGSDDRWRAMEGYLTQDIPGIQNQLQQHNSLQTYKPNVVVITAGLHDINNIAADDYAGLQNIRTNLFNLVNYVFDNCVNCAVLLGDLPPPGGAFQWPPTARQRQAIQFNAMIAQIVNEQQTRFANSIGNKRRISKVHFTVASEYVAAFNHNPTARGYQFMAYDIVERLTLLNNFGWIVNPAAVVSTPTVSPTSTTTEVSTVTVVPVPATSASSTTTEVSTVTVVPVPATTSATTPAATPAASSTAA